MIISEYDQVLMQAFDDIACNFIKLKTKVPLLLTIAELWITALSAGNKIIFCGNGGSAADCQHLAAELVGRYKFNRRSLAAISLTVDSSALTAIGNDYGYEQIFARQLEGVGQSGDILVGISTSGNSANVISAFKLAKEKQIHTVAFTGEGGGLLKAVADVCLNVPSSVTNNIQEMHIACGHLICDMVERYLCGERA